MPVGDIGKTGARSALAFRQETTYGTFALTTTAIHAFVPTSVNFLTKFDGRKLDQLAVQRGYGRFVQLNKMVEGSVEGYLHPDEGTLHFLTNALGGRLTFNSLTSAGDHSITTGNFSASDTMLSLSFWVQKGDEQSFRYTGGVINNLKISAAVGEPVTISLDVVFQDSSISTADTLTTSLSFSTQPPFTFVDGTFRYDATEGSLTSTVAEEIQSFELEINNNLVVDSGARELGSRVFSRRPPAGRREVKFKIKQRFDTSTTFNRFVQATQGAAQLFFRGASISAEFFRDLTITMPNVRNITGDVEIGGANEVLEAEIEYAVLVSGNLATSTSREIGCTLRNAITTSQ